MFRVKSRSKSSVPNVPSSTHKHVSKSVLIQMSQQLRPVFYIDTFYKSKVFFSVLIIDTNGFWNNKEQSALVRTHIVHFCSLKSRSIIKSLF